MTITVPPVLLPSCSTHFSGHHQKLAGRTSAWFSCTRLSTDSWLCHLTNSSLRTVERDRTTRTSSRPSVHRHQSTRILFSSYYTSLELCHATPWTRSRFTSTNSSAQQCSTHSIGRISQLESLPIICPNPDPDPDLCRNEQTYLQKIFTVE